MIVIVDYEMGNLGSVKKVLDRLKVYSIISSKPSDIDNASKLILPGVGHFGKAMYNLKNKNYLNSLNKSVIQRKTPILGICLGMQLFADTSEEGDSKGLGWLSSKVVRFDIEDSLAWKSPQIGWNNIKLKKKSELLKGISSNDLFYFLHSFHMVCFENKDILSTSDYSYNFVSSIKKNNIYGTQFHPEKSHEQGYKIIENFVKFC